VGGPSPPHVILNSFRLNVPQMGFLREGSVRPVSFVGGLPGI